MSSELQQRTRLVLDQLLNLLLLQWSRNVLVSIWLLILIFKMENMLNVYQAGLGPTNKLFLSARFTNNISNLSVTFCKLSVIDNFIRFNGKTGLKVKATNMAIFVKQRTCCTSFSAHSAATFHIHVNRSGYLDILSLSTVYFNKAL